MLGRVYSLKRKAAFATRVLPPLWFIRLLGQFAHSVVQTGWAIFLLFIQVPSVEEEPSDFIDKLKRGSSQPQDFNYIHSVPPNRLFQPRGRSSFGGLTPMSRMPRSSVTWFCRLVKIAVVTWFLFSRTVCVSLLGKPIKKRAGRSRVAARFAR